MTALAGPRATETKGVDKVLLEAFDIQLSAGVVVFNGGLVMTKAGYGRPAAAGVGFVCVGWAELSPGLPSVTGGATDGANFVGLSTNKLRVRAGCGWFNNSTSTDQILQANCGGNTLCYLADDNTVALTSNAGARSVAGVIVEIDPTGKKVLVSISPQIPLNPAVGLGTGFLGRGSMDTLAAAGAASVNTEVTLLNGIAGAQAISLADGLFLGQRKSFVFQAGSATPNATVTPATRGGGYASVSALGALGDTVEFVWANPASPAWFITSSQGVTIA
jgi:hypothetical protein